LDKGDYKGTSVDPWIEYLYGATDIKNNLPDTIHFYKTHVEYLSSKDSNRDNYLKYFEDNFIKINNMNNNSSIDYGFGFTQTNIPKDFFNILY
ncbi:MAG: hypothetical protein LBV42_05890, partial [Methanobrevibacter sp.]|jgi:hypothetical protein|nr:hypothetical protein [Methanobrevibacter sp.]